MSLFAELRRRNVIRMGGLYVVGAWLIVQVAGTVLPMFGAPDWIGRSVVILLAIGFVPALVVAWIFEFTPEGIKRDADVAPDAANVPRTAQRMNYTIIVLLVIALAYFAFDKFAWGPEHDVPGPQVASQPAAEARQELSGNKVDVDINPKSIAVLAFADMSAGKDSEYFADGISEEILNALAQVKDLKVAGRTSSFYFKGRNENLRSIGAELGVANVLEGSVRRQGDKVRITAQLIQVEDGFHRWSETFDGDMADVFALQERIARSISEKLSLVLSADQQSRLVDAGTINPKAYTLFLHANGVFNRRESGEFANAMALLEEAIEIDPNFARAHSRLGALYAVSPEYLGTDFETSVASAQKHARRALELRPEFAEPHAVMGYSLVLQHDFVAARAEFDHALAIDPDDLLGNFWSSVMLGNSGYLVACTQRLDHVLSIDPLMPNALVHRARQYEWNGDLGAARRMIERAKELGSGNGDIVLAFISDAQGRTQDARAEIGQAMEFFGAGLPGELGDLVAQGVFDQADDRERALAGLRELTSSRGKVIPGIVPWAMIELGAPADALSVIANSTTSSNAWWTALWSPRGRAARQLPEFPAFARQVGFAKLWDEYGAPDLCRKSEQGDYVCE